MFFEEINTLFNKDAIYQKWELECLHYYPRFLFQINTVLLNFVYQSLLRKKIHKHI